MWKRGYLWENLWENKGRKQARSDDARPFGHNTAALAVLITLKGYR
jgi:hypothetical protein